MIHLRLHTEYHFRRAYGRPADVLAVVAAQGGTVAAITDGGTWGHAPWVRACKARGIRPILGVEIPVVMDAVAREKQHMAVCTFLARNDEGLQELYHLVTRSQTLFYWTPRIDYRDVNGLTNNIFVLAGPGADLTRLTNRATVYLQFTPASRPWNRQIATLRGWNRVVTADNVYPTVDDVHAYDVLAFRNKETRTSVMHIPTEDELRMSIPEADDDAFLNTERIAAECHATLPMAMMVKPERPKTLREMCLDGAVQRGLACAGEYGGDQNMTWKSSPAEEGYLHRMDRELSMIHHKQFDDYFYVIADLVQGAKKKMLVGPARGSSAGSLVCYLLGITDVDPLQFGLLFERFIDVTRFDLPDIDIDFPDDRRDLAIEHLCERYGASRVGRIGTILRYQAKSAMNVAAQALSVPAWEIAAVADLIIERADGDARAALCIADTFDTVDAAKALLGKYPGMTVAAKLEDHAFTSGTHAAGVIVAEHPITNYCAIDKEGTAMIDKDDAEKQGMLKIDVLGLRTLAVLQDCLDQIGKTRDWLLTLPLDDTAAFDVINAKKYSGIFQFEGSALQRLTEAMKIRCFDDIPAISSLARPGPLMCGAADEFVQRRTGDASVSYLHPLMETLTRDTYGVIVYQEQVMAITRVIGQMSWEDVSGVRKAMSKSLGEEVFNKYWEIFKQGAESNGMTPQLARRLWDRLCTFGQYAFNKSHAVAYGILSYWCAVLKAQYPLEFAAATLRNAKDKDQIIALLRELSKEGYDVIPFDRHRSTLDWSVQEGKLYGGLMNVKGIGASKAKIILECRAEGKSLTPGLAQALMSGETPFDDIFQTERLFGSYYSNPKAYNITGRVSRIEDIHGTGEYIFLGKVSDVVVRDMNEAALVTRRKGKVVKGVNTMFLTFNVTDDTGTIKILVSQFEFREMGKPFLEKDPNGKWFLFRGVIRDDRWRNITVRRWRHLPEPTPESVQHVETPVPMDGEQNVAVRTLPAEDS